MFGSGCHLFFCLFCFLALWGCLSSRYPLHLTQHETSHKTREAYDLPSRLKGKLNHTFPVVLVCGYIQINSSLKNTPLLLFDLSPVGKAEVRSCFSSTHPLIHCRSSPQGRSRLASFKWRHEQRNNKHHRTKHKRRSRKICRGDSRAARGFV